MTFPLLRPLLPSVEQVIHCRMEDRYKSVEIEIEVVWSGRATHRVTVAVPEDWDMETAARTAEEHADEFETHLDDAGLESSFRVRPLGVSPRSTPDFRLGSDGVDLHDPSPAFVTDEPPEDRWFSWRGRRWTTNGIALVRDDAPRPGGFWVNGDSACAWMGRHPGTLEESVRAVSEPVSLRYEGMNAPRWVVLRDPNGGVVHVDARLRFIVQVCDLMSLGADAPIECQFKGEVVAYVMRCRVG